MQNKYLIRTKMLSAFFVLICSASMAQQISNCPASPYPITVKQADGSSLTIIGKGNLLHAWTETLDGYTVVNKNGIYEYANKVNGKLVSSGVAARNAGERKLAETEFLQQASKSIKPDVPSITDTPIFYQSLPAGSGPEKVGYPHTGNVKALLILIKYPDLGNTYTPAGFNNLMNQVNYRGTGSFKDFYSTSSFGQLNVTTDVFGWYTASQNYTYYGYSNGFARSTNLVREAVNAAQAAGVDFSQYDNDNDGVVDGIIVAHAGPGAEEGSQGQYIWSHRWVLSAGGNQVTYDGVLINDYIINPERRTYTGDMVGRGIFCHEFGHNLGLPDLYDTNASNGGSEGLGEWSLMASASWLGNEHTPGNMCAWSRKTLGWITPTTISAAGNYTLNAASGSNQVYRINTALANEYFLLENRQKTGLDVSLKGSGLAIFHVNSNQSGNGDENMKLVDLEEADGQNGLDNQFNRGDAGDLFPGTSNNTAFNDATNPNAKTYTNANTGINIGNISIDGTGKALFTLGNVLPPGGYCLPTYTVGCGSNDYINNFSLNTLVNNGSGCSVGAYINHDPNGTKTTQLLKGQNYPISVQSGPLGQGFGVWIDYNNDQDFDDAGEFVYNSPTSGIGVYNGIVSVPANVSTGLRRLRVRSKYASVPTALQSCTAFTWGETEDYTIAIGYCVPVYTVACSSGDYIDDFSFNTLVHNNSGCSGNLRNYTNYLPLFALTTTVTKGQSYPISMQSGPTFAQGFGVWIDYNNDQDFNDGGEFVYNSPTSGIGVYNGSVTIPAAVSTGQKRLRVRARWSSVITSGQSCDQFSYGETQDYTINVIDPVVASSQWNKRFGGSATDNFSVAIKTSDGGYLLGGHSLSGISGDKTQAGQGNFDFWIVKTDVAGNKLWDKRFGGNDADYLNSIIQTSDGGYLLGGNSISGISGDKTQASQGGRDFWVVKITGAGVKQWDKRFGGTGDEDLRTLIQTAAGFYFLAGYSNSPISGDKSQGTQGNQDYWIVKITPAGAKIFDKRYGGSGNDFLEGVAQTADGGFILGGHSLSGISGDKTQASQGLSDYWLVRINGAGAKIWDRRFGGAGDDYLTSMGRTAAGFFYIAGYSNSGAGGDKSQGSQGGKDYWMLKITPDGAKLWDKRFGGVADDELRSIAQTTDGGYIIGGKSLSGISGDKTQASRGSSDYWAVKTDGNGIKQWDKRFGGSAAEELRTVLQTVDGGYLLGGRSDSGVGGDKSQPSQGGTDYWLVKVSAVGAAAPEARIAAEAAQEGKAGEQLNLTASPNPFTEKVSIGFTLQQTEEATLRIYDSQGNEVKQLYSGEAESGKLYEFDWVPAGQKAGMYIIRLGTTSQVSTKKIVMVK